MTKNQVRLTSKLLGALADELGAIKAQIADLKKREDELKDQLFENTGITVVEGELFRAVQIQSQVETTDWKAVALRCEPSYQLVTAHTTTSTRTTVRVSARKE